MKKLPKLLWSVPVLYGESAKSSLFMALNLPSTTNKPRPGAAPKITGDIEARIITLASSNPPEGYDRWTLRLLADRSVEFKYIDSISHVAIYDMLKKTTSNLGK